MDLPWPLHFFKVFCERRLLGRSTPLLAGFKLTHRCNLRCLHCPFWREARADMPWTQVQRSLEALHQMGVRLVIFEGGEPLLWRDGPRTFADVARLARKRFLSVGVTTNGTLPLAGLDVDAAWVSLDGLAETHDALRGPSYAKALAHIDEARGGNVLANITVNGRNHREIPALLDELAPRVRGITLQFHYPYGRGEEDLTLSTEDRVAVLDAIAERKRAGAPVAVSFQCLEALKENTWTCHDFLLANVEPDGTIQRGCYVKNRGEVNCALCGFAAHTEISLAFDLNPASILAGWRIFGWRFKW